MAKVSMKSEKITPFGGIFHVREHFSRFVGPVIDKVLGLRCTCSAFKARDSGFFVKCLLLWRRLLEEQWLRMGKAAKVLHGREHCVPAADSTHTQLLQNPFAFTDG